MLKIKSLFRANGLFLILFGLFLFFMPELSLRIIIVILSIGILISGICGIIFSLQNSEYDSKIFLLGLSITQMIFGILLLCFPSFGNFLISLLVVILGFFTLIEGIIICIDAFKIKSLGINTRYAQLFIGILACIFGIFLITNAFLTILVLNVLFGMSMIIFGIMMIVWGFKAKTIEITRIEEIEEDIEEYDD